MRPHGTAGIDPHPGLQRRALDSRHHSDRSRANLEAKEIIVVDDGSTDHTLQIARSLADQGVHVIAQTNRGAAAARNAALRAAHGSYIQFLDADDLLQPQKIEAQLREAEDGRRSRVLLTCRWGRFFVRPGHASYACDALWRDLSPVDWIVTKFTDNCFMFPAAWLVSRRLIEAAGPWNERLSVDDDGEYICRLVAVSQQVVSFPRRRVTTASATPARSARRSPTGRCIRRSHRCTCVSSSCCASKTANGPAAPACACCRTTCRTSIRSTRSCWSAAATSPIHLAASCCRRASDLTSAFLRSIFGWRTGEAAETDPEQNQAARAPDHRRMARIGRASPLTESNKRCWNRFDAWTPG